MLIHAYHSFYFRIEQFPLKHYKQIINCVNSLSKLLKVTYYNNATNVSDCFHAINFIPTSILQDTYICQSARTYRPFRKLQDMRSWHAEIHRGHRIGWLRAAVLGANDGIVSTASLLLGVASANGSHQSMLIAGLAGLVAGAMSMAAGEYVSVHSQADAEHADLQRERHELKNDAAGERRELAGIYIERGLEPDLAYKVAQQLMDHDALGSHARDELGMSASGSARPIQAAFSSAASFAIGAALPLAVTALGPVQNLTFWVAGTSILFLALLGLLSGVAGSAPIARSTARIVFWGVLAMAVTAGIGSLFGVTT
jgi:VIT1/CCC1 family predicted Fe2+/Mn2+ transporter